MVLRASELFADDRKGVHDVNCLRRGDIVVLDNKRQLKTYDRYEADTVEVRFRG